MKSDIGLFLSEKSVILFFILLVFTGTLLIVRILFTVFKIKNKWTVVKAKCVGLDRKYIRRYRGHQGKPIYAPIFEYCFEAIGYTSLSSFYSNLNVPQIGLYYDIYINPDKPEELYMFSLKRIAFSLLIALSFLVAGLNGLCSALNYF